MTLPTPPVPGAILVIDTSSHSETDTQQIDWPTLAAAVLPTFPECIVIVKMSEGDWYVNPYRHRQRWGAHAAGFRSVGLYHYVEEVSGGGPHQGQNLTGAQNAQFFLKTIGDDGQGVPGEFTAGDWEDQSSGPTSDLDAMALDFGGIIQRAVGLDPMMYSGPWFAEPHNLETDPRLAQYLLWWAVYQAAMPPVPKPWGTIACWQFADDLVLPGLPFPVDGSWWLAGLPALRAIQWPVADPLAGQIVAGTPDIPVNSSGEAIDANRAFQQIVANLGKARGMIARGTALDAILATTQADGAAGALISGLQS